MRSGAGGARQLPVDGGELPFTTNTQAQAFSTSKTITAIAMVKALHDRGLTVDEKIAPFLPACWVQGDNVDDVTFRHLLDHTSGMPTDLSGATSYDRLKNFIAAGSSGVPASYAYNNVAYGMMRYLVPLVSNSSVALAQFVNYNCVSQGLQINTTLSSMFQSYIMTQVINPTGASASFNPTGDVAFLYSIFNYAIPGIPPNAEGWLNAGAGYLATSVTSFKKILGALDQGEILPTSLVRDMYEGDLGFDSPAQGDAGLYYTKAGGAGSGCNISGGSQLMIYPSGIHAYVTVNSRSTESVIDWYFNHDYDNSTNGTPFDWGKAGDRPVVGDFDRDGRIDDIAVFRPSTYNWYIDYNHNGSTDETIANWGLCSDVPLAGDFDGDGYMDDFGVFRPADGEWYFDYNYNGTTDEMVSSWGLNGDRPLVGDFDRDGRVDDVAVFRSSNAQWYFDYNHDGVTDDQLDGWGFAGDKPLAGDFDRDGRLDDLALYRPSNHTWYFDYNQTGSPSDTSTNWGLSDDTPFAGDFDGDGYVDDIGITRESVVHLVTILETAFDEALK